MSLLDSFFRFLLKVVCGNQQEQGKPPQQQQQPQPQPHTGHPVPHPPQYHQQQQQQYGKPYQHNDYLAHAQDAHYVSLRQRAQELDGEMDRLFGASREAYASRNGAQAKELSNRAKELKSEKERLNREAAQWIFEQNNKGREPGEVDLHGLRAEEAVERTEQTIINARRNGISELRLIVGKGLHSHNGEAVLKPRIEELMNKHKIVAELDPDNSGMLIVHLGDGGKTRGRAIDPDEITKRLGNEDKSCIIL